MKKDGGVSTYKPIEGGGDTQYLGSYYFIDAFPVSVGDIALDWSTQNQIETFTVNFEYQYWIKKPNSPVAESENPFSDTSAGNYQQNAWTTSGGSNGGTTSPGTAQSRGQLPD